MAKGQNRTSTKGNTTAPHSLAQPVKPSKPLPHLLIISFIGIVTWLFLQSCLDNSIGCWDDTAYIKENALVKDLSWEGIKHIFTTPSMGNYHPLTILSYAIEYSFVQLEPWQYHFDSLLLHLLCTVLVYWLVFSLSGSRIAAAVTALLFGLHPMHVESVAWAAARKDVLYGAFYIGALVLYVKYVRATGKKVLLYACVLGLFICALLSKPVAVTLPLSMLLIDYWEKRKWSARLLIEKLPHFVLALFFGIIAVKSQQTAGAMEMQKIEYNVLERIALGGYAFITYLWKALVPTTLRCLYHYPQKTNDAISTVFYLYPVIAITLIVLVWKYLRHSRPVVFGLLFFLANIALLLQFIQVGEAIVAERYSYIPYTGLFFIVGWAISRLYETNEKMRTWLLVGVATYIGCLGYISAERCKVWYDEVSLWRDEIEKEPQLAIQAYNNLAYIYYTKWMQAEIPTEKALYYDSSHLLFSKAIVLNPKFPNPYLGLGEVLRSAGKYEEAKNIYFEGVRNNPAESDLYVGLAILHYVQHNMDSAGHYFRATLRAKESAEAYGNYANYLEMVGKPDSALLMFGKSISMTRTNYVPYMNRGILHKKLNRWDEARKDLDNAMRINPDEGEIYYHRSFCDTQMHNYTLALQHVEKAISLGYGKVDNEYYLLLKQNAVK